MRIEDNEGRGPFAEPSGVFWREAYRGPPRPCVWCGAQCWDEWQQCNKHYRNHPWHSRSFQRSIAQLKMHERWTAQYVRRHPEHYTRVWSTLRAERLRWHWRGRGKLGWQTRFAELWGLSFSLNAAPAQPFFRA